MPTPKALDQGCPAFVMHTVPICAVYDDNEPDAFLARVNLRLSD